VLAVRAGPDVDGHVDNCAASEDGAAEQRHGSDLFPVSECSQQADRDHGQESRDARSNAANLRKA